MVMTSNEIIFSVKGLLCAMLLYRWDFAKGPFTDMG